MFLFSRLKSHRGGIDCSTSMAVGVPAGNPRLCSLCDYSEVSAILVQFKWDGSVAGFPTAQGVRCSSWRREVKV